LAGPAFLDPDISILVSVYLYWLFTTMSQLRFETEKIEKARVGGERPP